MAAVAVVLDAVAECAPTAFTARLTPARQFWALTGPQDALHRLAQQRWALWPASRRLWCGEAEARQFRRFLGRECDLLVIESSDYDLITALLGCLCQGGEALWLLPDQGPHPPSVQRLVQTLRARGWLYDITTSQPPWRPPYPVASPIQGSPEQAQAIAAILRVVQGHRRRPLVLRADRGRGKSAALGLAVAQLQRHRALNVVAVAPHPSMLRSVFHHASAGAYAGNRCYRWPHGGELRHVVPGALSRHQADLVLIDEAAAVPLHEVLEAVRQRARLVLSTTVHGYEGSGRGFELRLLPVLEREAPGWRLHTLETPIRWQRDDPVEHWCDQVFLLHTPLAAPKAHTPLTFATLTPTQWHADTVLLEQVFVLLQQAHYRTTPADLQHILDLETDSTLWVARRGDSVWAVLWWRLEGGFDDALARAVWLGQRRVPGHLLPQSLALHGGQPEAATLRIGRIHRIVVHPEVRRCGIGRQLIQHARQALRPQLDAIGCSFAADEVVLAFWQACGFCVVRLGERPGSSTGLPALQCVQPLNERARLIVHAVRCRWLRELPLQLAETSSLSQNLMVNLLCERSAEPLCDEDWQDLSGFVAGRPLVFCCHALRRWALSNLSNLSQKDAGWLVTRVVLSAPPELIFSDHDLTQLRDWVGQSLVAERCTEF